MSRGYRFFVVGLVFTMAVLTHLLAQNLFAPGTELYKIAASASFGDFDGEAWADEIHFVMTLLVPILGTAGAVTWAFISEYRRQPVARRVQ